MGISKSSGRLVMRLKLILRGLLPLRGLREGSTNHFVVQPSLSKHIISHFRCCYKQKRQCLWALFERLRYLGLKRIEDSRAFDCTVCGRWYPCAILKSSADLWSY